MKFCFYLFQMAPKKVRFNDGMYIKYLIWDIQDTKINTYGKSLVMDLIYTKLHEFIIEDEWKEMTFWYLPLCISKEWCILG